MPACPACQKPLPNASTQRCVFCGSQTGFAPGLPAAGPSGTDASEVPWERRSELGLWPAFWQTTTAVILRPGEFFRAMPVQGGLATPAVYGLLVTTFGTVCLLAQWLVLALVNPPTRPTGEPPPSPTELVIGVAVMAALSPIGALLLLFFEALVTHLALLLLKAGDGGFEATFRCSAYSHATWVLFAAPCLGCAVGVVWFVVARIIAIAAAHGIGQGRAAVAVLGPNLLCACCSIGLQILVFGSAMFLVFLALLGGAASAP